MSTPAPGPVLDRTDGTSVLTGAQLDVVRRAGRQVVLGGPATGKTRALVSWALHRSHGTGPGPVVLVPSRRAADRVRDAVEDRVQGARGDRVARTPHSLAWAVLREHALRTGARPPRLVTASERDEALAELLAGHAEDGSAPPWPPHLDHRLRLTRAFRDELREMSARAVEHGVSPTDLAGLGLRHHRPEWVAAAHVLTELEQVAGLRGDEAHDPASIVAVAADLLADHRTGLAGWLSEQVGHLGVDDAQDLTPAAWSFVREAADVVGDLLVVGDPDGATQTFRGAHVGLLERAADWLGDPGAPVHVTELRRPLRQAGLLRRVQAAVAAELHGPRAPGWSPAAADVTDGRDGGDGGAAAADGADVVPAGRVSLLLGMDRADEAVVVAGELRHRRHRDEDPVPWSQMAVLVRSVRGADELRRTLEGAGVPVRAPGVRAPLREEPVVDLLLRALEVAADPDRLDPDVLQRLCVGPLGGGDPVRWRRLVVHARSAARPDDGRAVSGEEALTGVCGHVAAVLRGEAAVPAPGHAFAGLPPAVGASLVRVVDVLAAAARAVPDGVEDALWQLWDRLRLAERWRRTALRGGPDAVRAHADLDAVMALFDAASAWVDRNPRGDVAGFVAHLRSRAVGDDRLGGDGPVEAVTVTTPAGAVGERWRVVVVAGVQDGVWPNPRLRGSLLGLTDLAEVLRSPGRTGAPGWPATSVAGVGGSAAGAVQHAELRRQARRDVVLDELRLFHVAVSRAVDDLVVTAADDATSRPSDLCTLVARAVGPALVTGPSVRRRAAAGPVVTQPGELDLGIPPVGHDTDGEDGRAGADGGADLGAGSTLVEVTALLRREAVAGPRASGAAVLLARLAAAGVRGADPREWSWLPATGPDPQRQVTDLGVSPSAVERFLRCPLQWYLTASGGTLPRETAQGLGTLVHAALEQVPDADSQALRDVVDHGWGDLELGEGWVSAHQRSRVEQMITKLAVWAAEQRSAGTAVVGSEVPFSYQVDDITVRGAIDRVELTAAGGVRVVDLKTGRTAVSAAEARDNPQLQLYQLAVESGALPDVAGAPAGGLLLFVGGTQRAATERTQPAPDADALEAARERVREVGRGMRAATFVARPGTACQRCPVRSSCPTTAEGRRTPPPTALLPAPTTRPTPTDHEEPA
ncbi:PD-(D/E)XK nuclease family protein [Aquipuribacter sp. MA13-6]|uniref:PD-(D/E)XK nuclease family protein n=1 Tax=unclassified Aquipuribacter TaxID=2635084 RepID=UPI003EEC6B43